MNKKRFKYLLISMYTITGMYIIIIYLYNTYTDSQIPYESNITTDRLNSETLIENNVTEMEETNIGTQKVEEDVLVENIQENRNEESNGFAGYNVIAILEIPKINLTTNVLEEYNKQALLVSVTKFWGPNPNEIGNFCISGHNYINKNMFSKLKKLEIGDKLLLTDNKNTKVEYEIYDIFKVEPTDTDVVSQKTNGAREVTLITCTSDSKLRIIVKAKEVNKL